MINPTSYQRPTNYQIQLRTLKKRHRQIANLLKETRSKSAELEKNGTTGFIQYQSLASQSCDFPELGDCKKKVENVCDNENGFHEINALLDAALIKLTKVDPLLPSEQKKRNLVVQQFQNQQQAQSNLITIELHELNQKIDRLSKQPNIEKGEKNFWNSLKSAAKNFKSIGDLVLAVVNLAMGTGINYEKLAEMLNKLFGNS